jgi:hypothetical protein
MRPCLLATLSFAMLAPPLAAQARHPLSVDVTVGPSAGWGGEYIKRNGGAGEVTMTFGHSGAAIAALTAGGHGSVAGADVLLVCFESPTAPFVCMKQFPAVGHLGVLGGVERAWRAITVRAMAGPAYYSGGDASSLGGLGQLDAAAGSTHYAVVAKARGSLVAHLRGDRLRIGSMELGLRVR